MGYGQYIVNGLLQGGLYACIAVGFALVWGVLSIVNMLHGTLVVLGAYLTIFGVQYYELPLALVIPIVCVLVFLVGYAVQYGLLNRVIGQPILITLTLTFGLDLILGNVILKTFTATPRSLITDFGELQFLDIRIPMARLGATLVAGFMTMLLYWLLRHSRLGRAIIAVRMDRHAAALMGIKIKQIYALAFAIGAFMAAAAGCAVALVYPVTPTLSGVFLGKAFIVCVMGGLGSVPGAIVGGFVLGMVESVGALQLGPQWATSVGFLLMMCVIVLFPSGLVGKRGFE